MPGVDEASQGVNTKHTRCTGLASAVFQSIPLPSRTLGSQGHLVSPRLQPDCFLATMILRHMQKRCTACPEGRLQSRNWIRATCVDDNGQRYPDSWTYYECDRCGDRSKRFLDGRIEVPSPVEWQRHCQP